MKPSLIVFDTVHGSTEKIAQWIREGMGGTADLKKANEVISLDYGLVIVGSPIYGHKPLKSITDFLERERDVLAKRKVALFVVCCDHPYPDLALTVEGYLQDFRKQLAKEPLEVRAFGGYLDLNNLNEKQREGTLLFWKSRGWDAEVMKILNNLDEKDAVEFGKRMVAHVG